MPRRAKKLNGFIKLSGLLILVSVVLMAVSMYVSDTTAAQLSKLTTLTDQAMLQAAMEQSPQQYIVMNAPLTGDACQDPLGILADEYVYLNCWSHAYTYRSRQSDPEIYDTSWDPKESKVSASKYLYIYGDIPLEHASYDPYCDYVNLSAGTVKAEYAEHIAVDSSISYYYPGTKENIRYNVRYAYKGIKQGHKVAFLAMVGDGKVILSSLKGEAPYPITGYNDMNSVEFSQDERAGAFSLVGLVLLGLGLFLAICGVIDMIGTSRRKRKHRIR